MDTYQQRYKALPTDTTLRATYGDDKWQPLEGAFAYWLDEFKKLTLTRKAQKVLLEGINNFSDPEAAIDSIIRNLANIRIITDEKVKASDKGITQRFERYLLRKMYYMDSDGQQVWGIRSGFEAISETKIGWMPGELIGIIARPSVGKSWILAREAVLAWLQGLRILFISPEMPESQIALRFDVLKAAVYGIPLSHRMTFVGHPSMEDPYRQLAATVGSEERWYTICDVEGGAIAVDHIRGFIDQFQPDMVFIDGISLLRTRKNNEWEAMKENMYALKYLATGKELPIMVSHQAVRHKKGGSDDAQGRGDDWKMPTLNDAAYGDAFVQAASTVVAMCSDQFRPDVRWYSVRKVRDREAVTVPRLGMWVDYDKGRIVDLSQYSDNQDLLTQQITRLAAGG